jgi:hypothetical protein
LRHVLTFAMIASASSFLKKKNPSWVLFCSTYTHTLSNFFKLLVLAAA